MLHKYSETVLNLFRNKTYGMYSVLVESLQKFNLVKTRLSVSLLLGAPPPCQPCAVCLSHRYELTRRWEPHVTRVDRKKNKNKLCLFPPFFRLCYSV